MTLLTRGARDITANAFIDETFKKTNCFYLLRASSCQQKTSLTIFVPIIFDLVSRCPHPQIRYLD